MVKIAIAGGSSIVAREIIDVLLETGKHEVILMTRGDPPSDETRPVTWAKVDYEDVDQLTRVLEAVNTVLSFVTAHTDPDNVVGKNLVNAAIRAGARRFVPSEWTVSNFEHTPWWAAKYGMREYLKEINKDKKVIEYTLFQPGYFLNYFTAPYKSAAHLEEHGLYVHFGDRRAVLLDGADDAPLTLTTVQDTARVVAAAIDYEGEWPVEGGIRGDSISIGDLLALAEKIRGPMTVERVTDEELEAGTYEWFVKFEHHSIPAEQREMFARDTMKGLLRGARANHVDIGGDWNRLLPDYEFTKVEPFLAEFWKGKP